MSPDGLIEAARRLAISAVSKRLGVPSILEAWRREQDAALINESPPL